MNFKEIERDYVVGLRHNPDEFYPNSFRVEAEGRRLVVVGVVKRHIKKHYRIVGIIKRNRD